MDLTVLDGIGASLANLDAGLPLPAVTPAQVASVSIARSPAVIISSVPGLPSVPVGVGGTVVSQSVASPLILTDANTTRILFGDSDMSIAVMTFASQIVGGPGWTNTIACEGAFDTPALFLPLAKTFADVLVGLYGTQTQCTQVRISVKAIPVVYPLPPRNAQTFVFDPPKQVVNGAGGGSAQAGIAMLIKMRPIAAVPGKLMYIHGFQDNFEQQGGRPQGTPASYYQGAWSAFLARLENRAPNNSPFGFIGQGTKISGTINTVAATGGMLTITLNGTPFSAAQFSTNPVIPVRFSRIEHPGFLNGVHPCRVLISSVLETTKQFAFTSFSGSGQFAYNGGGAFQKFAEVSFVRICDHKVGRPLGQQRGRARNRPTA